MPKVFERYYIDGFVSSGMIEHFYSIQKEIIFSDSISKTKRHISINTNDFIRIEELLKKEGICVANGFYVSDNDNRSFKTPDIIRIIYLYNSSVVKLRFPGAYYNISWRIISIVSETIEKLEETVQKLGLPLENLVK